MLNYVTLEHWLAGWLVNQGRDVYAIWRFGVN